MMTTGNEGRVLILNSGGTIGMLNSKRGYVPEKGFLTEYLRSQSRFHDPNQDSLFSNTSSAATYREWATASPPPGVQTPQRQTVTHNLTMRSSRVDHESEQFRLERQSAKLKTAEDGTDYYEWEQPSLVTPPIDRSGKRVRYSLLECKWFIQERTRLMNDSDDPLLDSSNMEMTDWVRLATDIELNYTLYDGFIILHGTDTMSFTASALSFLLEDLGKTLILTGAQIPLGELRNDAVENLLGSLVLAGGYVIPEVCLFFNGKLLRGNRTTKSSSAEFEAFTSPNLDPLAKVGINIDINWPLVSRPKSLRSFHAHKSMNAAVSVLQIFPGISTLTVKTFLAAPIQGVVLETFGAGNAPERDDLLAVFKQAVARGCVLVNITQCARGTVSPVYAGGYALAQAGIIPGGDQTVESALTKLAYLLSKGLPVERVRELVGAPIRGEITSSVPTEPATQSENEDEEDTGVEDAFKALVDLSTINLGTAAGVERSSSPAVDFKKPIKPVADKDSTAGWSTSIHQRQLIHNSLLPHLLALACAQNDHDALRSLIATIPLSRPSSPVIRPVPFGGQAEEAHGGGIVNRADVTMGGRTALHVAALRGSTECVEILLANGALVHLRDDLGFSSLYYACLQGHIPTVHALLSAGAHISASEVESGSVALAVSACTRVDERECWVAAGIM